MFESFMIMKIQHKYNKRYTKSLYEINVSIIEIKKT